MSSERFTWSSQKFTNTSEMFTLPSGMFADASEMLAEGSNLLAEGRVDESLCSHQVEAEDSIAPLSRCKELQST